MIPRAHITAWRARAPWSTDAQVDRDRSDQIVAVCARGRLRQAVPILDLPLPKPPPGGAEWIEAYRVWRGDR